MRISLHSKLLVSLITLVTISLSGMGFVLLRDADNRVEEFKFLQVKSQVRNLAEISVEPLLVLDYPLLENLVQVAMSEEYYAYTAIVSPTDQVIGHSNLINVGTKLNTSKQFERITYREFNFKGRKVKEIIHPISFGGKHLANAHVAYYLDIESHLGQQTIDWLTKILVFTLLVMTLGSLLISKKLMQPVIELTNQINKSFTDKHLNIGKSIINRSDEVGALARAFKSKSDQLTNILDELEHQIRERDHARAASDTKSAFLANVSHELRTPLNAIIGYSELLMETAEDKQMEEYAPDLEKISTSAKHLNSLIDDMLDLSKIEAGKIEIQFEDVHIKQFISDISLTVKPLIDKNNNQLICDSSQICDYIRTDPLRLKQILLNLISNAAKFTNRGEIKVLATSSHDHIEFNIIDSGVGMTNDQLGKVFNAFTQASAKTTIKYGGTGLGLTISRRLCKLMGGDVTATSEEGKGSTFTITLPLSAEKPNIASYG